MKKMIHIAFLLFAVGVLLTPIGAQTPERSKVSVVRVEGMEQVSKTDIEMPRIPADQLVVADGFSYYSNDGGIFLILPKPNNNVRLFALTGQVVWTGELVSGRFFIPTKQGIYILRVNGKSYKLSCK